MQIEYERGISNPGNQYRMKKLMARAEAGETLSIGFLGGSITQGCLASASDYFSMNLIQAQSDKSLLPVKIFCFL